MSDKLTTQLIVMADPMVAGVYNSTAANPEDWFYDAFGGRATSSGIRVSAETALTFAPWFQGVSIISGDVARVPLDVFERGDDDNREKRRDHPAWGLLNSQANRYMTAFTFRETMQSHALSWGNGYAVIIWKGNVPIELVPLMPDVTWPEYTGKGRVSYVTRLADGSEKVYGSDDILHVRGFGFGGLAGHSVFKLARNAIGLGLAAERHGSRHFANDARPNVVLKYPAKLDKPDADLLLDQWEARHGGSDNTSRPALAAGGLEIIPLSMSNEDSQFVETRKFQRDDVAGFLSLPPHKLGSDSRLSYNSVEAEERAYVAQTLMRWFARWVAECNAKLLTAVQKRAWWYCEHNIGALIQGDFTTQASVAVQLRAAKIITQNEARKKFNLNSVDGGDEFENPNTASAAASSPPQPPKNAVEAHCELIADRVRQLVRSECTSLKRLSKSTTPAESIEHLYERFAPKIEAALQTCIRAYRTVPDVVCVADAATIATRYCRQSQDVLREIMAGMPAEHIAEAIAREVDQWTDQRPAQVVEWIITGG